MAGRPYQSQLRTQQALATRERVVEAAARLFATDGYRRTTLARIAAAAQVSLETVQAQGAKQSLLGLAVQYGTFGREADGAIIGAPEVQTLVEATGPAQFAGAAARLLRGFNVRTSGLWRAFGSAAADDPAVDAEWSEVMASIRRNVDEVVAMLADREWLRTDVDADELSASLWLLIGAENYEKLTVRLQWSGARYEAWLARSIRELLFA